MDFVTATELPSAVNGLSLILVQFNILLAITGTNALSKNYSNESFKQLRIIDYQFPNGNISSSLLNKILEGTKSFSHLYQHPIITIIHPPNVNEDPISSISSETSAIETTTEISDVNKIRSDVAEVCCLAQCGLSINQMSNLLKQHHYFDFTEDQFLDYEEPHFRAGNTRIVGGKDVPITRIPWQVSFQRSRGYFLNYRHFCGGVIIHPQWIITAAHCFSWIRNNPVRSYQLNLVRMVSGSSTTKVNNLLPYLSWDRMQTSQLDKVIKYPLYRRSSTKYDLALVRLSQPLVMYPNSLINAICLPFPNQKAQGTLTVSGFGRTSESGKTSKTLQAVNVTIRSERECSKIYDSAYIAENMICAGDHEEDSCQGDSGGPLFQVDPNIDRNFVQGIVSYGIGCGRKEYPGIYTRVSYYVDWINKTINANGDSTETFNHFYIQSLPLKNFLNNDYEYDDVY